MSASALMNATRGPLPRRASLHRQVAEILSERIIAGELPVESLLPSERELCETMGVSRTVIREGIKLLESRGLVRIEHGRGTVVAEAHGGSVTDSLKLLLRRQAHVIDDLLEVRRILEVAIAGMAAERRTEANLRAMQQSLDIMRAMPEEPAGYVDADVEFHAEIARASQNSVMLLILESISDLLRESRIKSFSGRRFVEQTTDKHQEIFERVRARDPEGAREAMRTHLTNVKKDLARHKRKGPS